MKYGYFDDDNKEYVITKPNTPLPWINYLGDEEFYGIISNTAGGYCFYRDARLRRLTRYRYNNIPLDSNGRYFYVKDGKTLWNPMWKPMCVELDRYECRHGLGYTRITGRKNDIEITILFFIPKDAHNEIWDVQVKNFSKQSRSVRLWGFIEWCLWDAYDDMTNFQRNFSIGEVEVMDQVIFHTTEYRERRDHYGYFATNHSTSGFDSSRDAFVGVHNSLSMPYVIKRGKCTNSIAHGWAPVGVHQIDLELHPNSETRFFFLLGYAENLKQNKFTAPNVVNKEKFYHIFQKFSKPGVVENAFDVLKSNWNSLLDTFKVKSSDPVINRMTNIWNQYQCMVTFNMSRSASSYESGIGRGMGFRDSNQDVLGIVHMVPDRVRQRILDLAATQMSNGDCYHQYQPLTKQGNTDIGSGFYDDPLWLVLATSSYLKETGDFTILDEIIGFADNKNSTATLMDHLEISIQYTLDRKGPHELPLIGHADWNDCLNLNCFSETPGESFQTTGDIKDANTAESVMIAGLFCVACEEIAGIYKQLNAIDKMNTVLAYAVEMRTIVCKHGWDGEWFLRAYDAEGRKVGSRENKEGKIFIESQGWCILGGIGVHNGYASKALDSVARHLATPNGILLQQPAFQTYLKELGEISSYPPGYKENSGIFTHNNTWIQIAETLLGNGDKAFEYYMSICPPMKEDQIDIYRSEPYIYSQMTAGRDAEKAGEAKNSWLTGTAAWSFVVLSQYILGIKPGYDGLRIDPCIPKAWRSFSVTRKFKNAIYEIEVSNPDNVNKGVKLVIVDDEQMPSNLIPVFNDGKTHYVNVLMG